MVKVKVGSMEKEYTSKTTLYEIAKDFKNQYSNDIVLAECDGVLCELSKEVDEDCEVKFITTDTKIGNDCYRRSMTFLMMKAFYKVCDGENIDKISVQYSVSKGYFCRIYGKVTVTQKLLDSVEAEMRGLVEKDVLITKESLSTDEAIKLFGELGMYDKENLFKYRRSSRVNVYHMGGFDDYYYGYMTYSTGVLKYFKLIQYDNGFVLQMPTKEEPDKVPEFKPQEKVFEVLKEATQWGEMMGVPTIGAVNDKITNGTIGNIMLVQEALQEKKIADIATEIANRQGVKFVMIAGPSSSGKTSFSHRLSIQLMAQGLKPHPIPVDNFFKNREDTPVDEDGKLDYEVIEALDVKLFNDIMEQLLKGEKVEMPEFNFVTGKREYHKDYLKLNDDDILVIEGIHCLNDKMSYSLPNESKFKIYVSALTPLNVDEHNRIPTTDLRLIRRIVRDARTRGTSAAATIEMWHRVRRGEENNIFPYQECADAIFNSALVYELAVLKQYAEPALFSVPKDAEEYLEAKRLLKFLDYVVGTSNENVPNNSLLREFTGGSCFKV